MIGKPKGTKDVLPAEVYLWHHVEESARKTAEAYAFREIRTPVFEHTELFQRGVGDTTDIVSKEMYTFLDKGGRSVTLRPEGTAGVARAFLENGLAGGAMPFKAYYLISAFRYERPQAGRLREFHQFGAELYGAADPYADAEIISFADALLKNLGLSRVELQINSIGCKTCRAEYHKALKEYFRPHLSKMCFDCNTRFEKNPMRIIDCKEEGCKAITAGAPRILDYLCDDCRAHFESVQSLLKQAGVAFTVNPSIVRGLDYYSRTVFEFTSLAAGAQGTVLGGGRYDTLLEQMGEKSVPAVGFAAGMERLLMVLAAENAPVPEDKGVCCYLAGMDEPSRAKAFLLAEELRKEGISCECDLMRRSVKAQFKYADKTGARYVAVIGERELQEGVAEVKDMKNSSSARIEFSKLAEYCREK
ncbi:MAG: histidine--tRNA ligase [Clostridiales bacterium]|nr:histidine--tRNA ligase [Clostridiales bacterium]